LPRTIFEEICDLVTQRELPSPIGAHTANKIAGFTRIDTG
jgi:hypothetical protein